MAIMRLSIEVLQGRRDGDDPQARAAAVASLGELQRAVGETGIHVYPEEEIAPWGVQRRPDTFNLDFDTESSEEEGDRAALELVRKFLTKQSA